MADPTTAERLSSYLAAEAAILSGMQSYSVDGMTFTRADLGKVQFKIKELQAEINRTSYGGSSNRARFGDRG